MTISDIYDVEVKTMHNFFYDFYRDRNETENGKSIPVKCSGLSGKYLFENIKSSYIDFFEQLLELISIAACTIY